MIGGVYLAYPIDQCGPASLMSLFDQIEWLKVSLVERGVARWVFDPGDAFLVNPRAGADEGLARTNRAALNAADVVVAFLPAGVPSIGVPMEIDRARAQGKYVFVCSDAESYMLNMHGVMRFRDWDDAVLSVILDEVANLEPPTESTQFQDLPVKVEVEGCLPKRSYDDDAGLDLIVSEDVFVPLGEFRDIPCGVSVQLPGHTWALVTGRSSAFRRRGLLTLPGVIDAGYRGPLFAGVWAQREDVSVKAGERIAQLIVINNYTRYLTPIPVEELTPSMRGTNGFGSSGA